MIAMIVCHGMKMRLSSGLLSPTYSNIKFRVTKTSKVPTKVALLPNPYPVVSRPRDFANIGFSDPTNVPNSELFTKDQISSF